MPSTIIELYLRGGQVVRIPDVVQIGTIRYDGREAVGHIQDREGWAQYVDSVGKVYVFRDDGVDGWAIKGAAEEQQQAIARSIGLSTPPGAQ